MVEDRENKFRPILEDDPPQFLDRVNTPWETVPDLPAYNQTAYNRINRALKAVVDARGAAGGTQGILVLGEPGAGKTHLLMRVAQTLSKKNHVLFVNRPTNRHSIAQHIWSSIVTSLAQTLPAGNGRSQLDDLLAHVFRDIIVPELEKDVRDGKDAVKKRGWVNSLNKDAYTLFTRLGEDEQRQNNYKFIRTRTLKYLRTHHPDIDHQIGDVLIRYCFVSDDRKTLLLNWLAGQDLDEAEAKNLGVPSTWADYEKAADDDDVRGLREQRALRAITTIATLSTHYQPLILAFDQLEGLRGDEAMTLAWGDTVREIFTRAPNMLVVTCIFPSLWENWFQTLAPAREEWKSAIDRVAQKSVSLDKFSAEHALDLLAGRLHGTFVKHRLPQSIYPFAPEDVAGICEKADSPRMFLRLANDLFEQWLDGATPVSAALPAKVVTQESINEILLSKLVRYRADFNTGSSSSRIPTELAFIGQLRNVFESVLANADESVTFQEATVSGKVMPPNFVVGSPDAPSMCVAACNAEGTSLAACVRNFVSAVKSKRVANSLLLRDQRCREAVGVTANLLDDYTNQKGGYLQLTRGDFGLLNAIYEIFVAIEEHDLTIGTHKIDKREFVRFLREHRTARESQFLKLAAARFPPLCRALDAGPKRVEAN